MSEVQTVANLFGDETQRWVVEVTLATKHALTEQLLDAMADRADKHDMTVAARAHEPGVVFTAEVGGSEVALVSVWAFDIAEDATAYELADLRVSSPAVREAEAFRPDTPELLAATDVAELLGVTRQRVHQLHKARGDFPAPYVRLGSGPVWTRPAIEAFNTGWSRKGGRPVRSDQRAIDLRGAGNAKGETEYLLRSPANARRLRGALRGNPLQEPYDH